MGDDDDVEEVEVKRDQPRGLENNAMTDDDEGGGVADEGKKASIAALMEGIKAEREAEAARLKELLKVKIEAADVALIVREAEVEKKAAETRLREHGGDVVAALRSYA